MVGGTILPSQGEGAISSLSSLGGHSCNVEREAEQLGTKSGGGEGSVHPLLLAMGGIAQNGKADLGCSNPSSPPKLDGWRMTTPSPAFLQEAAAAAAVMP